MSRESDASLLRRTGKRKRAKKIAMDTGQLRPGDRLSGATPAAVQSDCTMRETTEAVTCRESGVSSSKSTLGGRTSVVRTPSEEELAARIRLDAWCVVRTIAAHLWRTLIVFSVLVVLAPGVASQGRIAPIITIPQGSLQGVSSYLPYSDSDT